MSKVPTKFNSDDEKANKDKKKIYDATGQRQCLPFKLLGGAVKAVPACVGG